MVSDFQKTIYNAHLKISRLSQNKPYKLRKKFDNLEEDVTLTLERLERKFKDNKNINMELFFEAPYKLYEDEDYFSLEFYLKRKAVKCYVEYVKKMETQNPDSEHSLRLLMKNLKYVYDYCKKNGLLLREYELNMEDGTIPCYVEHLKQHKINYYTLHVLSIDCSNLDDDLKEFIFPNFYTIFRKTKNKYYNSKKLKTLGKKIRKQIEEKLKQN